MVKNLFQYLCGRNLVAQCNDEAGVNKFFEEEAQRNPEKLYGIYCGFDPTAPGLTVGHLTQLILLRRAQDFGLQPIILFGGATGLIGDPTGRTDMRPMNTPETIAQYVENFSKLVSRYFRFDVANKPIFVNNYDWIGPMSWLEFNRNVGVHFTVARLLAAEVNKARLDHGLTIMEMSYQLMQAYDWLHLYKTYNCVFQVGGNDQWSNILAGADLIRRVLRKDVYCFTQHIIADKNGNKIGKTAGNAVWIDGTMTSPYDFFQFVRNIPDETVDLFYRVYTDLPANEIQARLSGNINVAKEKLAYEVSERVHGKLEADKSLNAVHALFSGEGALENVPTITVSSQLITSGIDAISLLAQTKICDSKGEARRLVQGNGLHFNNEKIADPALKIDESYFQNDKNGLLVKKGKKDFFLIKIKD